MDPLDMPDLDTVIDFETAYQVLTDFDTLQNAKALTSDPDQLINHHHQATSFTDSHNIIHHPHQPFSNSMISPTTKNRGKSESVESPQMMMTLLSSNQLSPMMNIHSSLQSPNINNPNTIPIKPDVHPMDTLPSQPIHSPGLNGEYGLQLNSMTPHANIPLMSNDVSPNQQRNYHQLPTTLNPESLATLNKPNKISHHELVNQEYLLQNHLSTQGIGDDLLSPFEANAIEKFLDNLIYNDVTSVNHGNNNNNTNSGNMFTNTVPQLRKKALTKIRVEPRIKKEPRMLKSADPTIPLLPIAIKDEMLTPTTTVSAISSSTHINSASSVPLVKESVIIDHEYFPKNIVLPDIRLDVMDYPDRMIHDVDSVQFKKWKHVEIEKMRRNQTKKTFDQLISMHNKFSKQKNQSSKRVAKYTLLNQIKDDINNIIKVNQYLQDMISQKSE